MNDSKSTLNSASKNQSTAKSTKNAKNGSNIRLDTLKKQLASANLD